jgi:putative component of toxin-antitoxin plasmid stabilization module
LEAGTGERQPCNLKAMPGIWTPEPFEADDGTVPYERFIGDLSDFKFVALDAAIDRVLSVRGIDLVRTEWLKALGEGLHEFRVRHDGDEIVRMFGGSPSGTSAVGEKVLLRVFVHFHGAKVILLLGGYDKGADPKERRQQREIAEARRLLAQFKERQRRQRRAGKKKSPGRGG